jgi:hypothetical protein
MYVKIKRIITKIRGLSAKVEKVEEEVKQMRAEKEEIWKRLAGSPTSGGSSSQISKATMMMIVIRVGDDMLSGCNSFSEGFRVVDLLAGLIPAAIRGKRKEEQGINHRGYQGRGDSRKYTACHKGLFFFCQIIKNNGLSEFWNNEAHKMWNFKVLALFIPVLIVSDVEWSDGSGGDGLMVGFSRLNESDE